MNFVQRTLTFVFGCHHKHLSRVFIINNRTYRVCFDCAREVQLTAAESPRFQTLLSEIPESAGAASQDVAHQRPRGTK